MSKQTEENPIFKIKKKHKIYTDLQTQTFTSKNIKPEDILFMQRTCKKKKALTKCYEERITPSMVLISFCVSHFLLLMGPVLKGGL